VKLSELLAEHPHLDAELGDDPRLFLDGVYLFRAIAPDSPPGDGYVYMEGSPGVDGVVKRGLVKAASEILALEWPVHVCGGDH
jgi:hypothetical protein